MLEQIECVLEERVRLQLALHGGDIQSLVCTASVCWASVPGAPLRI